jgi:hypothetical protein
MEWSPRYCRFAAFDLLDHATVRAPDEMDMAILLHDGLAATYPTSICHVRFHDTTRRVGFCAIYKLFFWLRVFPTLRANLRPPTRG